MQIRSLEYYGLSIKQIRVKSKLNQQEFSKKIGISRARLSLIENGKANISLGSAIEFLAKLGYEMEVNIDE
jgi:transcriptional regulator with XRE-family HTH domain